MKISRSNGNTELNYINIKWLGYTFTFQPIDIIKGLILIITAIGTVVSTITFIWVLAKPYIEEYKTDRSHIAYLMRSDSTKSVKLDKIVDYVAQQQAEKEKEKLTQQISDSITTEVKKKYEKPKHYNNSLGNDIERKLPGGNQQ